MCFERFGILMKAFAMIMINGWISLEKMTSESRITRVLALYGQHQLCVTNILFGTLCAKSHLSLTKIKARTTTRCDIGKESQH